MLRVGFEFLLLVRILTEKITINSYQKKDAKKNSLKWNQATSIEFDG